MWRWAATGLVWLLAPTAGVILVNLPTLVAWSARTPGAGGMVWGPLGAAFGLLLAWSLAVGWTGRAHRRHSPPLARIHYAACAVLVLLGLVAPWLYGAVLTGTENR